MSDVNFTLERYGVHISTDRPIYNLNEWVLIRGVILNGLNNHPLPEHIEATCTVRVTSPKGDEVAKFDNVPASNSVVVGSWKTDDSTAGGEYTVTISADNQTSGFVIASGTRKFEVREFSAPTLKMQAEFIKKGLGVGDTAVAVLNAVRTEGGIPAGAKVTATARIDGKEAWRGDTTLDANGDCRVTFKLPDDIIVGEGTLTFTVSDGGIVESIGKTIPILVATVKVNFYPEGGRLITDIETGLYFECFQTNGDPADIKGQLLSMESSAVSAVGFSTAVTIENLAKFNRVCELESIHEGRGKIVFTPERHNTYFMHVSTPGGIRNLIELPRDKCKIHKRGALIQSLQDTYQKGEPVELTIVSSEADDYTLKLYKRDLEFASAPLKSKGKHVIKFYPPAGLGEGVIRATLFRKDMPVAERLIFRHTSRQIKVKVTPNKETFKPNQKVKVIIQTTDDFDEPVQAVLCVTVTDDAKRKKAPRLPEMALLESEVNDFWDSQIYFKDDPKSRQAIDLLLGTQGWRRFVFFKAKIDLIDFLKENRSAERVFLTNSKTINATRKDVPKPQALRVPCDDMDCREVDENESMQSVSYTMASPLCDSNVIQLSRGAVLNSRPARPTATVASVRASMRDEPYEFDMPRSDDRSYDTNESFSLEPFTEDNEDIEFSSVPDGYFVRQFTHVRSPLRDKTVRSDFTKTLFWVGSIETDESGEAVVDFTLSESITSFRVMVDAFNRNNGFGVNDYLINSVEPFSADVRTPIEVTVTDEIQLPVALVNNTKKKFTEAKVRVDVDPIFKANLKASQFKDIKLSGNSRGGKMVKIIAERPGTAVFNLEAKSGSGHLDKVVRQMRVMPLGFPQQFDLSGTVQHSTETAIEFEIPTNITQNSIHASLSFFPSPSGNYEALCNRLCNTPGGCFEQVGSTMFPLVLAAQWLATKGKIKKLDEFAPKIAEGYGKIKGYEVKGGGFEWYGDTPAHTALTAFGIVMLLETMPVFDVDKGPLDRSIQWLLDQRDGYGEFKQSLGRYAWASPPKDAAHAYIMWALAEAGVSGIQLEKELAHLNKLAEQGNSYVMALAALANHRLRNHGQAKMLADKLTSMQDMPEGSLKQPGSTIVHSGSESAVVEATALSMLVWMRIDSMAYLPNIELARKFLTGSLSPYGYGNSQGTSLTLKAINTYNIEIAGDNTQGSPVISVHLNDKLVEEKASNETAAPVYVWFPDAMLSSGKHKVQIKLSKGSLPYQLTVNYSALTPYSAADCAVKLEATLTSKTMIEGEGAEVMVKVTNVTTENLPMVLAIIGLPGGFEPRHEQLKDLVKKEKIDFYEVIGRNIALYWRGFDKAGVAEFPIDVVATVPGTYTGPASRVFVYYTPQKQHWIDGLAATINPK